MNDTCGRREANKRRTRTALVEAAYDLLESGGPESLTAERLADAAGISRRTFFNYFESVEAVIASRADDILGEVRQAFTERPADEPLVDSAYAVIAEIFTLDLLREATRVWRAIDRSPAARRFALEANSDHAQALGRELGEPRLDPGGADPLRAAVLVAVLITAFDEARRHWLDRHDVDVEVDEAALAELLDDTRRAFDAVRPAFVPVADGSHRS